MGDESKLTPNTHLGAVSWWRDMHFGSHLYVCQGMLGLDPKDKYDYHFINSKTAEKNARGVCKPSSHRSKGPIWG